MFFVWALPRLRNSGVGLLQAPVRFGPPQTTAGLARFARYRPHPLTQKQYTVGWKACGKKQQEYFTILDVTLSSIQA